jgi:hypothetical protein
MTSAEDTTWLREFSQHYPGAVHRCIAIALRFGVQLVPDETLAPGSDFVVSSDGKTVWYPTTHTPTDMLIVLAEIALTLLFGSDGAELTKPRRLRLVHGKHH